MINHSKVHGRYLASAMRCFSVFLILILLLSACTPLSQAWTDVKSDRWADDAVFYEIFVRSFYDSNGDGIGDLNGVLQKLDYLNDGDPKTTTDLGVTALWLMPIFPSPSYHGYDVTDYYSVNPEYGTMNDLKALVAAVHARDMKIIIDLPINHTSSEHPWFVASAAGDPTYRDYYIWSDTDPKYLGPWGETVWHPLNGAYYYGVFYDGMPDLNFRNPAVTEEVKNIAAYWLTDAGVDGFRIDGARHLIEDGPVQENTPETLAWFQDFRAYYQNLKPAAITVGEVWSSSVDAAKYVNEGAFDMVFNFALEEYLIDAANSGNARTFANNLSFEAQEYDNPYFGTFLSNHDQDRMMSQLGGKVERAKVAASLLLTTPGTPFLYYGEEIGMTGTKPDEYIRTPMQWEDVIAAGFSTTTPWLAANVDYHQTNVATEQADANSLLAHYQALIRIREDHYALRTGELVQVQTDHSKLYASLRVAENESVLVLVNLSDEPVSGAQLSWGDSSLKGEYQPTLLMGDGEAATLTVGEAGAVEGFAPVGEIPAGGTVIIQYR